MHDYLLVMRGAERVFAQIAQLWPTAEIHTLLYDESGTGYRFAGHPIHPSYLQRLGVRQEDFRKLLPLYPHAVRTLRTRGAPLVVSSSSAFAHGVPVDAEGVHVCYCHSPFRYIWHERARTLAEAPKVLRPAVGASLSLIRHWDRSAARRVTHLIANSRITQQRIRHHWGCEAAIVHPPVEVQRFRPGVRGAYALTVGELVPHKRARLALEAARRAKIPIKVVGAGPERAGLEAEYRRTAEFLGRVDDQRLAHLYAHARVVIVPAVEEFGIVAVEAQASGCPVVAPRRGGAAETVVDGRTGVLVERETPEGFASVLRAGSFDAFDSAVIAHHARRFSPEAFARRLRTEIRIAWEHRGDAGSPSDASR